MEEQSSANVILEVTALIRAWEEAHNQPNYYPVPLLVKLAEKIEAETENYLKMDPDPFDERHPSRSDPDGKLGQILKVLFKKDSFMTKLLNDYVRDTYYSRLFISGYDADELNIAACRLMLDILPGLETSVVFQPLMDGFVHRLIKWATNSVEPLQSYATGLLAAAMEVPEIATRYRESNARLVPLMLQRLRSYQAVYDTPNSTMFVRPFAHLSNTKSPPCSKTGQENGRINAAVDALNSMRSPEHAIERKRSVDDDSHNEDGRQKRIKRIKLDDNDVSFTPPSSSPSHRGVLSETSNSSWAELETYMIGNLQLYPITLAAKQILILRYLTPMGEYQEFLSHVFENNVMELILRYVNIRDTKEARLAFEALKYLAAVLCHKKFSIEFVQTKGLECLLDVPRPSIAATGVSICLYYLSYCEEAMERVCLLPKYIISSLVKYALWLLECSHDSGRCHATMFFGLTFQFRVILDEFDEQDGLRKLYNVISTLPILSDEDYDILNDDAESSARQIVRHVCVAYKRYMESHLYIKAEQLRRSQLRPNDRFSTSTMPAQPIYKACKSSPEEIQQQIDTLLQIMPYRTHWQPVEQLIKLGAISLLLKIIAFTYEWNSSGRAETVRSALDVLAIACVIPKVVLLLCDRIDLPDEAVTVGVNIILGAAEGEIVADPEVQKAALRVIVNCVCAPVHRVGTAISRFSLGCIPSPSKKTKMKSSEELLQRIWDSVRSNSGIMVLMQLMNIKIPITDADCIRTLACKALAGLARSDTVRQIVSKLPLFTSGQLHVLMRDPILQEKRQEHVSFQRYTLELLEALSGKTKHSGNDLEVSLGNIHKANIVAQTKIHFNDKQLLQLIYHHLSAKGLHETASILTKEANLSNTVSSTNSNQPPVKFRYLSSSAPNRIRLSFSSPSHNRTQASQQSSNQADDVFNPPSHPMLNGTTSSTIKIKKKPPVVASPILTTLQKSRIQKQLSGEPNLKVVTTIPTTEENLISNEQSRVTLNSIITEYLTNQHALCKNPMSTCPQFNLFVPHKCPDPKPKIHTAHNFTTRLIRKQIGYYCQALDRKLIHSRFCPIQTIRLPTEDSFYTAVAFLPGDQSIIAGSYAGDLRIFNVYTGIEEMSFSVHDGYVSYLQAKLDGKYLITCSTWGRPLSSLFSLSTYEAVYNFEEDEYLEFSKVAQDRLVGTKGEIATIYDITNGHSIARFMPTVSNQYTRNKATFNYTDDLILSDGVLFDINSGKSIHKLDKLNQTQSGVFHPNGLEIVSNTEVWDMRTFKLLKTVPVLNQSRALFSTTNNVIYAIALEQDVDDLNLESSFKTVDALDYSSIATVDVKRKIHDLAINGFERQIALVENQGAYHTPQESVIRIYDVGRKRDDEDELEEEDDDDEEDRIGSEEEHSEAGVTRVRILNLNEPAANNENNGNEDENYEDGNESNGSWTDVSDEDDSSNENNESSDDDDDLSTLEDLIFL